MNQEEKLFHRFRRDNGNRQEYWETNSFYTLLFYFCSTIKNSFKQIQNLMLHVSKQHTLVLHFRINQCFLERKNTDNITKIAFPNLNELIHLPVTKFQLLDDIQCMQWEDIQLHFTEIWNHCMCIIRGITLRSRLWKVSSLCLSKFSIRLHKSKNVLNPSTTQDKCPSDINMDTDMYVI